MLFNATIGAIMVSETRVRLLAAQVGGGRPKLLAIAEAPVEYDTPEMREEALVDAIETVVEDIGVRPASYVLCMPGAQALVRSITVPFRGKRRVMAAAPIELEPHLALPLEELVVDFLPVAEVEGQTDVLAVAMRQDSVVEWQALLAQAGVAVDAVLVDIPSLTGAWMASNKRARKGLQAVLHLQEDMAGISVVHNGSLAFFRNLSGAGAYWLERPALLAREVQNTLRAFGVKWRRDGAVSHVSVTGIPVDAAVLETLSGVLQLPVEAEEALSVFRCGRKMKSTDLSAWAGGPWASLAAAAASLGERGATLNLSRPDNGLGGLSHVLARHLMVASCLALAVLVCWVGYYRLCTQRYEAQAAQLKADIAAIETEVQRMTEQGLVGADTLEPVAFKRPLLLDILKEVAEKMSVEGVTVRSVKFLPPGAKGAWMRIGGVAKDSTVFNTALEQLKTSTLFRVDGTPDLSMQEGKTQFEVKITDTQESGNEAGQS